MRKHINGTIKYCILYKQHSFNDSYHPIYVWYLKRGSSKLKVPSVLNGFSVTTYKNRIEKQKELHQNGAFFTLNMWDLKK